MRIEDRPVRTVRTTPSLWATAICCASAFIFAACSGALYSGDVEEYRNPAITGDEFRNIALIAGDDTDAAIRIAARVRQLLEEAGWDPARASGRWETEDEALEQICGMKEDDRALDGVLIVWWNKLTLKQCGTKARAFEARGSYAGIEKMTDHLLTYFGPRRAEG